MPTLRNAAIPVAIGLAATLIVFLLLQTFLIATALGTGDYENGLPGGVSAGALRTLSVVVVALACAIGSRLTARNLRRADVERVGAIRVGALTPAPVVVGIVANGLIGGAGVTGPLLVLAAAAVGTAFGVWTGSSR